MITVIARKELRELTRDGRFRAAGVLLAGLLFVTMATGWQQYRSLRAQHEAATLQTREQWLGQGEKNPHSAAHYGIYAFKPQAPLSFVDRGVTPYTGTTAWLEAHVQNDFSFRPAQDAPAVQRFGDPSAASVLQIIVPLLIVLFGFGIFAGEREQGTLRQLASLGVEPWRLAVGKSLGTAAALALLIVPASVLGGAAIALHSGSGLLHGSAGRTALLIGTYLLYFTALIGITLAVSAVSRTPRTALTVLLGVWIVNSVIAPRAVPDVARRLVPVPGVVEFSEQIGLALSEGVAGDQPAAARAAEFERQVLAEYGVARIEDLPINYAGLQLQAGEEHANDVYDSLYGDLWDRFERQNRVHTLAGVAAPLLAVRSLSMGLAGTDFAQHRHFAEAAEQYRRMLNRRMNEDLAFNAPAQGQYMAGPELWHEVPEFTYAAPPVGWVLERQSPAALILLLWAAAGPLLALLAARRMRVE